MKIYSPSRTEAYDQCSMRGYLEYTLGYHNKEANNGTVGKIVGGAFAEGTRVINSGLGDGLFEASEYFNRTVDHYMVHGVSFNSLLDGVREECLAALVKYQTANPLKGWQIKGVEVELAEYGHSRLDVLGVSPVHGWSIVDIKYKRYLKPEYLSKTITEYQHSWQFQHYPWAYNQWRLTQPEGWGQVNTMALLLVVAKPWRVQLVPFVVDEIYQRLWYKGAQQKWSDVAAYEAGNRIPVVATNHDTKYGPCPMKKACLEYGLDEGLMQIDYVRVPKQS